MSDVVPLLKKEKYTACQIRNKTEMKKLFSNCCRVQAEKFCTTFCSILPSTTLYIIKLFLFFYFSINLISVSTKTSLYFSCKTQGKNPLPIAPEPIITMLFFIILYLLSKEQTHHRLY